MMSDHERWRLLFQYWKTSGKPRAGWAVLTPDGELIGWFLHKRDAQRDLTAQYKHAFMVRIHPPDAEYNVP